MCQQQMDVVVDKRAWLEDEMLHQKIQEKCKDTSNSFSLCRLLHVRENEREPAIAFPEYSASHRLFATAG